MDYVGTTVNSCAVSEDTAQISLSYEYQGSGTFMDWYTGHAVNEAVLDLDIVLSCKRVDGEWKLYRINSADLYMADSLN